MNPSNIPEDFLSFARMVIHAHQQDWGQFWTQREIDGLFYNQFLNPSLQHSLRHVRKRFLNSDQPPYPCRWDSEGADSILIRPFGSTGWFKPELGLWHRWEKPNKHGTTVGGILIQMASKFSVPGHFLTSAFLHGTPVTFTRLEVGSAFEWPAGVKEYEIVAWHNDHPVKRMTSLLQRIPYFEVVVYSLPVTSREMIFIAEVYADFLKDQAEKLEYEEPREPWEAPPEDILVQTKEQMGSHIVAKLLADGVPSLQIRSYPPFASPSALVSLIEAALDAHKTRFPGNTAVLPRIRTWTTHLLNQKCNLTNRSAIRLWNESLGCLHDIPYTMDDGSSGLRGFSVASPGEAQFSRERKALVDRIDHYQQTLTRRRPPMS